MCVVDKEGLTEFDEATKEAAKLYRAELDEQNTGYLDRYWWGSADAEVEVLVGDKFAFEDPDGNKVTLDVKDKEVEHLLSSHSTFEVHVRVPSRFEDYVKGIYY